LAVKYVVYEQFENNRMYIGNNDIGRKNVDVFKMNSGGPISDYPGIERREGYYFKDSATKSWMTHYNGVMHDSLKVRDVGEVEVVKSNEKFSVMRFSGGKMSGDWYFRKGKDDRVLMWKPGKLNSKEKFTCAKKCDKMSSGGIVTNEKFSSSVGLDSNDGFAGTALASGVYSSWTGRNLLFTNKVIEKIVGKYKNNPKKIKVDWNHDENHVGDLSEVRLETEPVHRMYVVGNGGQKVKSGSALSLDFEVTSEWDDKFKVHRVVDADITSVTIATGEKPECKVCYVDKSGGRYK